MDFWYLFFLILVLFNYVFSNIIEYLNNKSWNPHIPDELSSYYDKKRYDKAREYKTEKSKVSLISGTISFLITFCLIFFKGFGYISNQISLNFDSSFLQASIFFLLFYAINFFISLPISYYSTFYIEEKFGFNKTTIKTFFLDRIKSIILTILIGGVLLALSIYTEKKSEHQ